jgi:hypothetical protein
MRGAAAGLEPCLSGWLPQFYDYICPSYEIGASESPEAFDRAFENVVSPKPKEGRLHPFEKPVSS